MDPNSAENSKPADRPADSGYEARKKRVTPRQLWAQSKPHPEPPQEPSPIPTSFTLRPPSGEPDAGPDAETEEEEQEVNVPLEPTDRQEDETDSLGEMPGEGKPAERIEESPSTPVGTEDVHVRPTMRPGAMDYPYATHRPPPQEDAVEPPAEELERKVSGAFLLGILIIVAALVMSFALIKLHRRVSQLEQRVEALEGGAGE